MRRFPHGRDPGSPLLSDAGPRSCSGGAGSVRPSHPTRPVAAMLIELRIRDYAVIEDLRLELGPGLTVLSGETGAGKSIIVGALSLLLGERASSDVVRAGAPRARVEAVFDVTGREGVWARLREAGVEGEEGLLILSREVASEGRNRAWVNGSPATAGLVGELGRELVHLHGQHEHQALLRPEDQRGVLDAFAGNGEVVAAVRTLHGQGSALRRELETLDRRRAELAAREDFLRFQWEEIRRARIEVGEDLRLEEELRRLEHAEELLAGSREVAEALYSGEGSISDLLAGLRARLRGLALVDGELEESATLLDQAYHDVVEVGRSLERYASSVELDPGRLEAVRSRLDLLHRLKRKYGPGLAEVAATEDRLRRELDELEGAGEGHSELSARLSAVTEQLRDVAGRLGASRREAAGRLARAVEEILPGLGMEGARLEVRVDPLDEVGPAGAERVEFLASLNAGFDPRPLARIASGGELSRVMLALTSILARADQVPTLVFDEVDAGVGGTVAVALAERLREVARRHQVFVITHLAQVASRADRHLLVKKVPRSGLTRAQVCRLEGEGRVLELARMLGGDPGSAASREHARELLATAGAVP